MVPTGRGIRLTKVQLDRVVKGKMGRGAAFKESVNNIETHELGISGPKQEGADVSKVMVQWSRNGGGKKGQKKVQAEKTHRER